MFFIPCISNWMSGKSKMIFGRVINGFVLAFTGHITVSSRLDDFLVFFGDENVRMLFL